MKEDLRTVGSRQEQEEFRVRRICSAKSLSRCMFFIHRTDFHMKRHTCIATRPGCNPAFAQRRLNLTPKDNKCKSVGNTHSLSLCAGVKELDQVIVVLFTTHMFIGGFFGFVLDNTIPGRLPTAGEAQKRDQRRRFISTTRFFARHRHRARHPQLEGQGSDGWQVHVRPVVLRHPVLRGPPGEVSLLALLALPADVQDVEEAEVHKVITLRCWLLPKRGGADREDEERLLSTSVALFSLSGKEKKS